MDKTDRSDIFHSLACMVHHVVHIRVTLDKSETLAKRQLATRCNINDQSSSFQSAAVHLHDVKCIHLQILIQRADFAGLCKPARHSFHKHFRGRIDKGLEFYDGRHRVGI